MISTQPANAYHKQTCLWNGTFGNSTLGSYPRKSYWLVRTSISWTISLSIHCRSDTGVTNALFNAPWTYKWHGSEPRKSQLLFNVSHLWFSSQREKLAAVIASVNIAQDVYTPSYSMAMYEAVRNEKSLKPASIKSYIVANCKCNLIQSVLTWLWGSTYFLALLDLHPKFICTAFSARARPRKEHYVRRKHYPGASWLPLCSTSSKGKSLCLGISLASCSHCFAKPSIKLWHFSWGKYRGKKPERARKASCDVHLHSFTSVSKSLTSLCSLRPE